MWSRTFPRLALAVGLLAAAPACTTQDRGAAPDASAPVRPVVSPLPPLPPEGLRLSCGDAIPGTAPPPGYRTVAGAVAVPTAVLGYDRSPDGPEPAWWFAKWGLYVRAGAAVEVRGAPGWAGRARIGWGRDAMPAETVQVGPCPAASATWLVFTGGTWVSDPSCVPLVVDSGGQRVDVPVAVGTPCAGPR